MLLRTWPTPRIFALLSVASLLATGCTTPTVPRPSVTALKPQTPDAVEVRRERLVGWWYGDQPTKEGGRVQWIMRRAGDGSFAVTFRTTDQRKRATEQTEVGEWGVNADLLITVTRGWLHGDRVNEAPAAASYFWDVYKIHSFDTESIRYRSVETGNEYHVTRVPVGFGFPD